MVNTSEIPLKKTRTSDGTAIMTLKAKKYIVNVKKVDETFTNVKRYRKNAPSIGAILEDSDAAILK